MTAQLSRERLEALANLQSLECMALPASHAESAQMARMLLEGMDSEPVIIVGNDGGDALAYRRLIQSFAPGTKLYTAPPAPVAVPDIGEFRIFTQAGGVKVAVKDGKTKNHLFGMGWNACRTALLKAGPVTGWIKCSERMPDNKEGLWSKEVIALSDLGEPFKLSAMGGYWQRTQAFIDSGASSIVCWMPIPTEIE